MAKKKSAQVSDKPYKVSLDLKNRESYQGEGDTLLEALNNINVDGIVKANGTVTATLGDKTISKMVNALRLQRVFGDKTKNWVRETAMIGFSKYINSGLL